MPTYEYQCTRCGTITEEFKSISAARRQRCPACRGKVERLISGGAGVHFKGSGFYVTDSRAKKGAGEGSPSTIGSAGDKASVTETTGSGNSIADASGRQDSSRTATNKD